MTRPRCRSWLYVAGARTFCEGEGMSKRQSGIVADVRRAIAKAERGGMSLYAIAKAAGIPRSQMGRIASGENLPRLDTAENILQAIGLRLTIVPK